jgi:hypothetical protein
MGRYYSGNINGKFWFGIQPSNCMVAYGAGQHENYYYISCGCSAEEEDEGTDFCRDCYQTREEHLEDVKEEGEDGSVTTGCEESYTYTISKEAFEEHGRPFINEHATLFTKHVKNFKIDDEYNYDFDWIEEPKGQRVLADVCMLKLIEKWFEDNEEDCCFEGES